MMFYDYSKRCDFKIGDVIIQPISKYMGMVVGIFEKPHYKFDSGYKIDKSEYITIFWFTSGQCSDYQINDTILNIYKVIQ